MKKKIKLDKLYTKSCQKMPELPDESVDFMPTDPPYGIGFMGKMWDKFEKRKPTKSQVVGWMSPTMKKDTRGMVEFFTPIWKECFRVLKPGAFAFVMCIPRQDCLSRMIVSLEDAGFNVSFSPIFHTFASGFPKAMNIGKAVQKKYLGVPQGGPNPLSPNTGKYKSGSSKENLEGRGYGAGPGHYMKEMGKKVNLELTAPQAQALDGSYSGFSPKPAVEMVIVAMKPLETKTYVDQALKNRKGVTWLENGKIPYITQGDIQETSNKNRHADFDSGSRENKVYGEDKRSRAEQGNYDASKGRFPANLLCSDDALNDGKIRKNSPVGHKNIGWKHSGNTKDEMTPLRYQPEYGDSGSFSRYFSLDAWFQKKFKELPKNVQKTFPFLIIPKASKSEKNRGCEELYWEKDNSSFGHHQVDRQRWIWLGKEEERIRQETGNRASLRARGNIHPTVKSLKLFCYLITLGSREGDVILDPFMGSGTTAVAARMLARHYVGWETGPENVKIAKARLSILEPLLL